MEANQYKKDEVKELKKLIESFPIIGIADISNLPAGQLQNIKFKIKQDITIKSTKKRLFKIALKEIKDKNNIQELGNYIRGTPLLIFSKKDSFRLSMLLKRNRSNAPAKAGQLSPNDITIPAGPTEFTPGPIIGELGALGLKTAVEGGKIAIKQDKLLVKEGEVINAKVASLLAKLGIQPMKIGLNLVATYENGNIFKKDELNIDEEQYMTNLGIAASNAFNLAFNIEYPTKNNIMLLISKNASEASSLATKVDFASIKEKHKEHHVEVKEHHHVKENHVAQEEHHHIEEESEKKHNEVENMAHEKPRKENMSDEEKFSLEEQKAQEILKREQDKKLMIPLKLGPLPEKPIRKAPKAEELLKR